MRKSIRQTFHVTADKVVEFTALSHKRTEVYNANLSDGERLQLDLFDKPRSAVAGIAIAVKDVATGNKKQGIYVDPATKEWYVSGAFMNASMKDAQSLFAPTRLGKKISSLFCQAFEQCEDVSKKPIMQRLKPL